jgi:hypothetical protein
MDYERSHVKGFFLPDFRQIPFPPIITIQLHSQSRKPLFYFLKLYLCKDCTHYHCYAGWVFLSKIHFAFQRYWGCIESNWNLFYISQNKNFIRGLLFLPSHVYCDYYQNTPEKSHGCETYFLQNCPVFCSVHLLFIADLIAFGNSFLTLIKSGTKERCLWFGRFGRVRIRDTTWFWTPIC